MNISEIIKLKYPNARSLIDFKVQDDGQGPYIKEWNISDKKPSDEDLANWGIDLADEYQLAQNKILNEPIYQQLEQLDLKSIRALRANDTQRLTELEAQAEILRGQLK